MAPTQQGAYRTAGGINLTSELWSLLWGAAASNEYRARLCAVEWACDLFDFSNVAARRVCISLCDDKVTAVRSAASRGLHPPRASGAATGAVAEDITASSARSSNYPTFEAYVLGALHDDTASAVVRGGGPAPAMLRDLPPAALAQALDFALDCRRAHCHGVDAAGSKTVDVQGVTRQLADDDNGQREAEAVDLFFSLIETTLLSAPSVTDGQHGHTQMVLLHRSAAVALQKLAIGESTDIAGAQVAQVDAEGGGAFGRRGLWKSPPALGVAEKLACRGPWLQQWLGHEGSAEIREAFAEATGAAAVFMDPDAELVPLLRALGLKLKVGVF